MQLLDLLTSCPSLHQCAFPTLMSEPKPCRGAHGLGLLLSLPVSGSASTSHGIAPMAVSSWCTGHCAPVLCIGTRVLVGCLSDAPSGHGIAPMVLLAGSLAQGLCALVLARGGARPHHALCCCSHGLHATHVVEPMCACSVAMPGCLLGAVKARPCPSAFKVRMVPVWLALGERLAHPWCARDACLARPWCARDACLARPWCARGARLARPRCSSGSPAVLVWLAHGARAVRVWLAHGARAVLVWLARGACAVLVWLARGARAVLVWHLCDSPTKLQGFEPPTL
uniref:Uncharacterized protein n=1 Tax=Vitis vinifera TaxID=29760 RepID=A5AXU4_VITVI|nr:hypothetical protein VITISV_031914 [Vitis vinifera]